MPYLCTLKSREKCLCLENDEMIFLKQTSNWKLFKDDFCQIFTRQYFKSIVCKIKPKHSQSLLGNHTVIPHTSLLLQAFREVNGLGKIHIHTIL